MEQTRWHDNNGPYEYAVSRVGYSWSDLHRWCDENDITRFCYSASHIMFHYEEEAIMFKMGMT